MRKNIKLLVLIVFIISLLTGCVSANYLVTINSDGSVDLSYTLLFEKTLLQFSQMGMENVDPNQNPVDRYEQDAKDKGYTTERITEGELEGFIATKKLKDISEMELLNFESGSEIIRVDGESYEYKKGLFRNHYSMKLKLDRTPAIPEGGDEYMEDDFTYAIMSSLDLKLSINLPSKPANSNSSIVENNGKTHTWVPEYYMVTDVQIDGYIASTLFVYAGIAIAIILIGVLVFFLLRKSRKMAALKEAEQSSIEESSSEENSNIDDGNSVDNSTDDPK